MWQIEVVSEKKMRLKADELLGYNFKAEMYHSHLSIRIVAI